MHDRTGAAFLAALQNLNELSERLAVGRDDDDYLRRLANAAQDTAIAAREAYAETLSLIHISHFLAAQSEIPSQIHNWLELIALDRVQQAAQ